MRRRDLMAIAATQQVREMQEGAAINYNPRSAFACDRTPEPTLGKTIQLCFYLKKETSEKDVQRNIFNNSAHGYSISTDRNICVCYYPKADKLVVSSYSVISLYELKSPQTGMYNLCVTIDHEGLSKVYRDGVLVSQLKQRATTSTNPLFIGLGAANMATPPNLTISNGYGFAGNVMLLRIFNYALSASQIAALYNNGKPEEYLLPAADKNQNTYDASNISLHSNDSNRTTVLRKNDKANGFTSMYFSCIPLKKSGGWQEISTFSHPYITNKTLSVRIKFLYRSSFELQSNYATVFIWDRSLPINTGDAKEAEVIIRFLNVGTELRIFSVITLCAENDWIEIQPISYSFPCCIAEYLPQNLITAHDGDMTDKTPIAWLDSAKQLPLNDEYLPPLLQGVGGYDLTALGTPEIVEKARVIQRQEITDFNVEGRISEGGG